MLIKTHVMGKPLFTPYFITHMSEVGFHMVVKTNLTFFGWLTIPLINKPTILVYSWIPLLLCH